MQPTQKKPLTAFTVISTIILLLLTVLFIFPFYWILTGAFKSQPDTIMIPPQWFPKMPNHGELPTTHGAKPCYAVDVELCIYLASNHVPSSVQPLL